MVAVPDHRLFPRDFNYSHLEAPEASFRIERLSTKLTLLDMYIAFSRYGKVDMLEIYEDNAGERQDRGLVRFRNLVWDTDFVIASCDEDGNEIDRFKVRLKDMRPRLPNVIISPVDPQKRYPEIFTFPATRLEYGFMHTTETMMKMHTVDEGIMFQLNLGRRCLDIFYKHTFLNPETGAVAKLVEAFVKANPTKNADSWEREEFYRFRIKLEDMTELFEEKCDAPNKRGFAIPVKTPPATFRVLHDAKKSFNDPKERKWTEWETWFRQTEITYIPQAMTEFPTSLKRPYSQIDIGRWTTYRFSFHLKDDRVADFENMLNALRDFNIQIKPMEGSFKVVPQEATMIWDLIDSPRTHDDLNHGVYLPFPIRYQLEAALSWGVLSEHNLTVEFLQKLASIPERDALAILEEYTEAKVRVYEPMKIFDYVPTKSNIMNTKHTEHLIVVRKATITPTTIMFETPCVEPSNRVLRQYAEHADRFLRVQFTDERKETLQFQRNSSSDTVFTRVHNTLRNGITIGDRHYEFLAFGSSQFREHGAYMFASNDYITAADIRRWMGKIQEKEERCVGKYCARLGQCFSATRAVTGVKVQVHEIPDIKRNGYIFSDGVGKISEFVAKLIAGPKLVGPAPSAYQFRLGGNKGVLTVWPDVQGKHVYLRPSQNKFTAPHNGLEIIRSAECTSAHLNKQLILVLTALGVEGSVFEEMLAKGMDEMKTAMSDPVIALKKLTKNIDEHQMTLVIAQMIRNGFMAHNEPFLMTLLQLWRSHAAKSLKEKTKICVEKGAFLLGVVDETGILKGHFNYMSELTDAQKLDNLPEIFCQVSDKELGKIVIIEGICIICRNPSLHPGDIRVVRAVNVPQLHHLRDVLVLPQTGDRDLGNMCSGGDLDGDDYMICWDERLIPKTVNFEPMKFENVDAQKLDRPVEVGDMIAFFVNYMKTNRLGQIANTHLVWADKSDSGVLSHNCLELAELHSTAVDYPKSGKEAVMRRSLRVHNYPHFMEKKNGEKTYHSRGILGLLYDQTERVDFNAVYDTSFDPRLLSYKVSDTLLEAARKIKLDYDVSMKRILGQYSIETEFEIYSTFILKYKFQKGDYVFHEEVDRVAKTLKERYREYIARMVGGEHKPALGSFVVAMYFVTRQEVLEALEKFKKEDEEEEAEEARVAKGKGKEKEEELVTERERKRREKEKREYKGHRMPMMSFPWVFHDVLGKLATKEWPWFEGEVEFDPVLIWEKDGFDDAKPVVVVEEMVGAKPAVTIGFNENMSQGSGSDLVNGEKGVEDGDE
ncbi:RNA dependent RNA polymerase-domain-containing protein [Peziza echinospora]|nr:RNA dependent RNA polymerase-domain-containing protein [Peziza echinospora]